jgi:hypothetical protein
MVTSTWLAAHTERLAVGTLVLCDAFRHPAARIRRLAETLEVLKALWSGETVSYDGAFHHLKDATQVPGPIGTISVVIGGTGPKTPKKRLAGRARSKSVDRCLHPGVGNGPSSSPGARPNQITARSCTLPQNPHRHHEVTAWNRPWISGRLRT